MRRAAKPRPEAATSGAGLRALATLVADALNELLGPSVTPALAGPVGPLSMHVEVTSDARAHRVSGRHPQPGPALEPEPEQEHEDDDESVNVEHEETWRLVTRAQAGDGEAFGLLYDRYVDTVFRFIY